MLPTLAVSDCPPCVAEAVCVRLPNGEAGPPADSAGQACTGAEAEGPGEGLQETPARLRLSTVSQTAEPPVQGRQPGGVTQGKCTPHSTPPHSTTLTAPLPSLPPYRLKGLTSSTQSMPGKALVHTLACMCLSEQTSNLLTHPSRATPPLYQTANRPGSAQVPKAGGIQPPGGGVRMDPRIAPSQAVIHPLVPGGGDPRGAAGEDTAARRHPCPICGRTFPDLQKLERHASNCNGN